VQNMRARWIYSDVVYVEILAVVAAGTLWKFIDPRHSWQDMMVVTALYLAIRANYGVRFVNRIKSIGKMQVDELDAKQISTRQLVIAPRFGIHRPISIGYTDSEVPNWTGSDYVVRPEIACYDQDGNPRLVIRVTDVGRGELAIIDRDGQTIGRIVETPVGLKIL